MLQAVRSMLICAWIILVVLAARPASGQPASDLAPNQWHTAKLTGLKPLMSISQSRGSCVGLVYARGLDGFFACGDESPFTSGPPKAWKLDIERGAWAAMTTTAPADWPRTKNRYGQGLAEAFWGNQVCYDSGRGRVVGLTSTAMSMTGQTVEYDVRSGQWFAVRPGVAPPVVTAASLCYDPINQEVVLATGGFSEPGGTDGTWLYDCRGQSWRRLAGPQEVEDVVAPLQAVRSRLFTVRWLTWKSIEFVATGREAMLKERAHARALGGQAEGIVKELRSLAEQARRNAASAGREYHRKCLVAASELLGKAGDDLAGLPGRLAETSAEQLEVEYRARIVPALERVEQALAELATSPEPRMNAKLIYDSRNKLIVCFGGNRQDGLWGDTWVYHCDGRWWERRRPSAGPSPRNSRAMAFDERSGLVAMIESAEWSQQKDPATWVYDAAKNEWARLDIPAARESFWMDYDASAGLLVALSADLATCWKLRLDLPSAKGLDIATGPDVLLNPIDGPFVLRDAVTVAELKAWKEQTEKWARGLPANTWVPLLANGTGRPHAGRTWSSIVHDPHRRQIYYRDGGHGSYHGAVTDHYDVPTGRWFRSARREEPCWPMGSYFCWGRSFSGAPWGIHTYKAQLFYNPVARRLLRSIGSTAADKRGFCEYDPDTGAWAAGLVESAAPPAGGMWMPVPGTIDRLLLVPFGRTDNSSGAVAELTADGWKSRTNAGAFAGVDYPAWEFQVAQYDPKRNRVLRMGPGGKVADQLWSLDLNEPAGKWTRLTPTVIPDGTTAPESGREMVYIPKHDVFLMPDGAKGKVMDQMCVYDPVANTWRRIEIQTTAESAAMAKRASSNRANGLAYDPIMDLCYFCGAEGHFYAFRYVPDSPF